MKTFFLIFIFVFLAFADKKPLVLSLSGGGARGFAHVGVLKYFEEAQIVPDTIIGTSMGALVAALYACGYSAGEIYDILKRLSNTSVMFQRSGNGLGRRTGQAAILNFQIDENFDFMGSGGIMPFDVLDGKIPKFLSSQMHSGGDFNKLAIPLRIATTNLSKIETTIHKSGDIFKAVKASSSVPGVFAPVKIGDDWHVDGGIRANIPLLDTVKNDDYFVLAVDITSEEKATTSINSVVDVVRILMTAGLDEAKKRNTYLADLVISPLEGTEIKNYHFHLFSEIVRLGYESAKNSLANIPEMDVYRGNERIIQRPDDKFWVEAVRTEGLKRTNERYLRRILDLDTQEQTTTQQVRRIRNTINAINVFDEVFITGLNDTLIVAVEEKKNFNIGFGIRVDNRNLVELLAAPVFNNIFGMGISHGYEFQIGYLRKKMVADLLWQMPLRSGFVYSMNANGYLSSYRLVSREINFIDNTTEETIYYSEADIVKNGINLIGGFDFANSISLFGGIRSEFYKSRHSASGDVGFDFANSDNRILMFYAGIKADNRNDVYFPSRGGEHAFWFSGTNRDLGSLKNFFTLNALSSFVIPVNDLHTMTPLFFGTFADQQLPDVMRYYIGGARREDFISSSNVLYAVPFAGVRDKGLSADNFLMARLRWTYQFTRKYPLYLSFLVDCGNLWNYTPRRERELLRKSGEATPSFFSDIPVGMEAELALKTPVGPVRFSWSRLISGEFQENFGMERENIFRFSAGFDF